MKIISFTNNNITTIESSLTTNSLVISLISFISIIILLFSPLISFAYSLLVLIIFSELITKRNRIYLSFCSSLSLAIIVSSRAYGISISDDFANSYYNNYLGICNGDFGNLFAYGAGIELGLPLFFLLISLIIKNASPSLLIFFVAFLCSTAYCIWVEIFGLACFEDKRKALVTAYSILMLGLFYSSQLSRQFISSILILYALFSNNNKSKYAFLLLGIIFHLTAILTYVVALVLKNADFKKFTMLIVSLLLTGQLFIYFVELNLADVIPVLAKLSYWTTDNEIGSLDLATLNIMILVAVISLIPIIYKRRYITKDTVSCLYLFWGFFVAYVVLLPYSMMPIRFTLIINSLLLGWVMSVYQNGININYVKTFGMLLLIVKVNSYAHFSPLNEMTLWAQFSQWSIYPGYFLY